MLNNLKATLFYNWTFARIIRLGLGIVMIVQSFQMQQIMLGLFGSFFLWQGLMNKGCGVNGCGMPMYGNAPKPGEEKETTYEEIKKEK